MTPEERGRLLAGAEISDSLLAVTLEAVRAKVRAYCRREDIPEGLELIVDEMAADAVLSRLQGDVVQSIRQGDTTVTYAGDRHNAQTGAGGADFLKNYARQLQQWRKII